MRFDTKDVRDALNELSENYSDEFVNNNKSVGGLSQNNITINNERYFRQSMKRSNLKNVTYESCSFERVAFSGSSFNFVTFKSPIFTGNSFSNCDFYDVKIIGNDSSVFSANNFSQSNFINCDICDAEFNSSGFLQTLFYNCNLKNVSFQSNTMEGSQFRNCNISDADMGSVNVEFISLRNTTLNNVIFPFYQLPYIIGAADYIRDINTNILLRVGPREINMSEYRKQLNNLIIYYWDKSEYFAMCNLYIALNDFKKAKECFLDGINLSLIDLDFRMIKHYCRLSKYHNILNEATTHEVLQKIDDFITGNDVPEGLLNDLLIHAGEIRGILLSRGRDEVGLHFKIRTNVNKNDSEGTKFVNELCNNVNEGLTLHNFGQKGFNVSISNHSPDVVIIDIIFPILEMLLNALPLIWMIFSSYNTRNKVPTIEKDSNYNLSEKYFENLLQECSEIKIDDHIDEIIQIIDTDTIRTYKKKVHIIKKINKK